MPADFGCPPPLVRWHSAQAKPFGAGRWRPPPASARDLPDTSRAGRTGCRSGPACTAWCCPAAKWASSRPAASAPVPQDKPIPATAAPALAHEPQSAAPAARARQSKPKPSSRNPSSSSYEQVPAVPVRPALTERTARYHCSMRGKKCSALERLKIGRSRGTPSQRRFDRGCRDQGCRPIRSIDHSSANCWPRSSWARVILDATASRSRRKYSRLPFVARAAARSSHL